MKKIVYTQADGTLAVVHPCEGARLARGVTLADGTEILAIPDASRPVDTFLRRWPVVGAVVDWAETEDEFVARIAAKDVPAGATDVQIVDADAIPTDRTFRNAWKADGVKVTHDMSKCREIHKDRLRQLRAPKLAALDIEYQRADEHGDLTKKQEIALKKKALRDVTADPLVLSAKTPDELKRAIPEVLK